MFGILVALPLETRRIVTHRMQVGDVYSLSDNAVLIVTGMGESAIPIIRQHAESGQFSTLLSLGTAVGLSPLLTTGTVCIPDEIVQDSQTIRCHQGLQAEFIAALQNNYAVVQKRLAHASRILACREEKESLYHTTQADAADMESFLIGQEAQRCQLNFLAIRVVLDSMHLHMPQSLLNCCMPVVSVPQLLMTLLREPRFLPTLLSFANKFNQTQKILNRITQVKLLQSKTENRGHYVI